MRKRLFLLLALAAFGPGVQADVLSTDTSASQAQTAKIADLAGDVRILKRDASEWLAAKKEQTVEAGDQIITGKSSFADIAYDAYLLNITRIKENTKAEFRTISPTDIYMEDGSIFSALDGLDEGNGYQIATPTAVAAVRGTHFDVEYDPSSKKFTAASLPTGDAGHQSRILVSDPRQPQIAPVEIVENKQMDLKFGEPLHAKLIRAAEPQRLQAGQNTFQQMGQRMPQFRERREQGKIQFQERREQRREQLKQQGPQNEMGKSKEGLSQNQNGLQKPGPNPLQHKQEGPSPHRESLQGNRPEGNQNQNGNGFPPQGPRNAQAQPQSGPQQPQEQRKNFSGPPAGAAPRKK